jgi:hypothetical protein
MVAASEELIAVRCLFQLLHYFIVFQLVSQFEAMGNSTAEELTEVTRKIAISLAAPMNSLVPIQSSAFPLLSPVTERM